MSGSLSVGMAIDALMMSKYQRREEYRQELKMSFTVWQWWPPHILTEYCSQIHVLKIGKGEWKCFQSKSMKYKARKNCWPERELLKCHTTWPVNSRKFKHSVALDLTSKWILTLAAHLMKEILITFNPPSEGPCFKASFSLFSFLFCSRFSLSGSRTPRASDCMRIKILIASSCLLLTKELEKATFVLCYFVFLK